MNFSFNQNFISNPEKGYRIEVKKDDEWMTHLNRYGDAIIFLDKINAENYLKNFVADDFEARIIEIVF